MSQAHGKYSNFCLTLTSNNFKTKQDTTLRIASLNSVCFNLLVKELSENIFFFIFQSLEPVLPTIQPVHNELFTDLVEIF